MSLQSFSPPFLSPPRRPPPPPALLPDAMSLETVERDGRLYFARDVEPMVLRACRARRLGFDLFATRFSVPRAELADILRGRAPLTPQTRRILEDFIARSLGNATA